MLLIGLLLLLITVGVGGVALEDDVAATKPTARATLTISSMQPLEVIGRGFKPGERVVVSTGTKRKSVTANSRGRFVVRFAALRCAGGTIVAVGSKGSRASTRPPRILCIEP